MNNANTEAPSSYVQYLPGVYQADAEKGGFVGKYLKIFEKILSGINDQITIDGKHIVGIEQVIDKIFEFFHPEYTPYDFLKWLAGWMALILRDDWGEIEKRRLMRRIVSLYRIRGTKKGLEEYIKIYVGPGVEITEAVAPFQIGVTSTISKDTYIDGGPPHFFQVTVNLPEPNLELKPLRENAVRAIIDLEKPAHTYYHLKTIVPTLQIEVFSTIGKDTLLGDIPMEV